MRELLCAMLLVLVAECFDMLDYSNQRKNQVNQIFLHCVVNWLTLSQKKGVFKLLLYITIKIIY